jgi:hypothetical protein
MRKPRSKVGQLSQQLTNHAMDCVIGNTQGAEYFEICRCGTTIRTQKPAKFDLCAKCALRASEALLARERRETEALA